MLVQVIVAAAAVCLVKTAPMTTVVGKGSQSLPAEHRHTVHDVEHRHAMHDVVDAVLSSKTVSAMDEAAARVTSAFGDIIDDLGNFVVATVQDLPHTIREVSDRVGQAVSDGNEQVVITVRGVKKGMESLTTNGPPSLFSTVDRVVQAANSSQTASSLKNLQDRLATSVARIFGSMMLSLKDIDTAVADGISQVSGGQQAEPTSLGSTPPSKVNEIPYLA